MTAPVSRITIHHEGAGVPRDGAWSGSEPYSILIGPSGLTIQQSPWSSWATYGYNHVSLDLCLAGNRMTYPVTDTEIGLIRLACQEGRQRGWIAPDASVFPHGTIYPPPAGYPTGSSPTQCPGTLTIDRWPQIVGACAPGTIPPSPPAKETGAMTIVRTSTGKGYWIVDSIGAVFAYGDAAYHGGMNTQKLNAPIVGMAATPTDAGYWLLGQDGGVFGFGDATFYGAPTGKVS